jgi:hypothetical protein
MIDFVKGASRELAGPILRRLGAIGAAYLVTQGVPEELANQVAMAAGVFAGLAWDAVLILKTGSTR